MESIVTGLEAFWKAAAMMGVGVWVGLFWRRATVAGVWAGSLAGIGVWLLTESFSLGGFIWDFNAPFADKLPAGMLWEGKLYLPYQMLMYLGAIFSSWLSSASSANRSAASGSIDSMPAAAPR